MSLAYANINIGPMSTYCSVAKKRTPQCNKESINVF